jgi:hypothetical protein
MKFACVVERRRALGGAGPSRLSAGARHCPLMRVSRGPIMNDHYLKDRLPAPLHPHVATRGGVGCNLLRVRQTGSTRPSCASAAHFLARFSHSTSPRAHAATASFRPHYPRAFPAMEPSREALLLEEVSAFWLVVFSRSRFAPTRLTLRSRATVPPGPTPRRSPRSARSSHRRARPSCTSRARCVQRWRCACGRTHRSPSEWGGPPCCPPGLPSDCAFLFTLRRAAAPPPRPRPAAPLCRHQALQPRALVVRRTRGNRRR